jgi:uncharacterized protein (TIGR02569 family)
MTVPATGVPPAVLDAFELPAAGQALAGGEGRSYLHGSAVLKPVDNPAETVWAARLLASVHEEGFRLPRPLRARDGRWVVDGWAAAERVAGETGPAGRWEEVLAAGRNFHAGLEQVPRPELLDQRTHRWAVGDRVAWNEQSVDVPSPAAEYLARLQRLVRPVAAPSQLIHGDLSGNVLFAPGLPPAIIDFSPFWRPARYADAIVVADGLLWFGAGPELVTAVSRDVPDFGQLLARAVIFRLIALTEKVREVGLACLSELEEFRPVIDIVEHLNAANRSC